MRAADSVSRNRTYSVLSRLAEAVIPIDLRTLEKKTRFLVDENVHTEVVRFLRAHGWNVKSVDDVALRGHSDEDVLAFAHREDRILLTDAGPLSGNPPQPFHEHRTVAVTLRDLHSGKPETLLFRLSPERPVDVLYE